MKRFLTITGIIIAALIVGIIFLDTDKYEIVDVEVVEKAIEDNETFVLVIGISDCNGCIAYEKTLKSYVKDPDIPLYVLYIDKSFAHETEYRNFVLNHNITSESTPTTYIFNKGKITDSKGLVGAVTLSQLKEYISLQLNK